MTIPDIILATICLVWLILTILRQANRSKVQHFDVLDLIPNCRFFAPKPISKDYRLYSQICSNINSKQDVYHSCFEYKKSWYNFFWNPDQKIIKTTNDLCTHIMLNLESKSYDFPYLILLNLVNRLYKENKEAESIRFVIVAHKGYEDPSPHIVFRSNIHNVDRSF